MKNQEAISKLEEKLYHVIEEFNNAHELEVKDIVVRYAYDLPAGNSICLLTPKVTLYEPHKKI